MPGPLDGIRVIDVSAMVSGPLATMILGDQGADVFVQNFRLGTSSRKATGDGDAGPRSSSCAFGARRLTAGRTLD